MPETPDDIDWKAVYKTPFLFTKICKLMVFQFKLLNRRLATNVFLTSRIMSSVIFVKRIKRLASTYFGPVIYPTFFGKNLNSG